MNTGTNHKLELTEPTSTMTPQNKLPRKYEGVDIGNGVTQLTGLESRINEIIDFLSFLTPQEEGFTMLEKGVDNQKWEESFRGRLIELDDYNQHMNNIHEPIKGDIYFDGIEIEQFIRSLLSSEYDRGSREMAEAIMKKVKSKSTLLTEVSEYEAGRQKVLDEIEEILTTYLKG